MRPATRQILSSTSRGISTTPARLANQTPPESPSYVRLPTPPQSEEHRHERVRGALPVPRDLFPRRGDGPAKTSDDYLRRTAPTPSSERHDRPKSKVGEWKARMANTRRENLDAGLQALWTRRKKDLEARRARSRRRHEANRAAMLAPERDDDRLTRGTVLQAMLDTKVYADPDRFRRAEESRRRVQEAEAKKAEARQDALMELYINAANFITTEDEMRKEIDSVFTEEHFVKQTQVVSKYGRPDNVWGAHGPEQSVSSMLQQSTGSSTRVIDFYETEYDRSVKRQKRIAEDLTGGKME